MSVFTYEIVSQFGQNIRPENIITSLIAGADGYGAVELKNKLLFQRDNNSYTFYAVRFELLILG